MSLAAGLAVPGFLAAAAFSVLGSRFAVTGRVLAVLSVLLLLPVIEARSSWPFLALAAGAAALGSPLPSVLAAAGATLAALHPEAAGAPIAPVFLGLAAALAAGSVSSSVRARRDKGADPAGLVAFAGAALVALLLTLDGGRVLRWAFGLGAGTSRLELPGAGLLLGLAFLACLAGTLLLVAHRLAPAVSGARLLGLRFLLPGAAFGVLATVHIWRQGLLQKEDALAAGAAGMAALVLLMGVLMAALARVLAADLPAASPAERPLAARETALAVALTWLAVGVAGWESWRAEGTYLTRNVVTVTSAGMLGLAATAETRVPGARRLLLLVTLAAAVLFPEALR